MLIRFFDVHPVSIPCTPLVHGLLGALEWLGRLGLLEVAGGLVRSLEGSWNRRLPARPP